MDYLMMHKLDDGHGVSWYLAAFDSEAAAERELRQEAERLTEDGRKVFDGKAIRMSEVVKLLTPLTF